MKALSKEIITEKLVSTYLITYTFVSEIQGVFRAIPYENDTKYSIPLKCECINNDLKTNIFFGCIDRHVFDIISVSYLTLGAYLPFTYEFLLILILGKLLRTCGIINEFLYSEEIVKKYGKVRKYQTLINILGDILSFLIGNMFSFGLSFPILLFILISLNVIALPGGGSTITMIMWWRDCLNIIIKQIKTMKVPKNQSPQGENSIGPSISNIRLISSPRTESSRIMKLNSRLPQIQELESETLPEETDGAEK
jgi:hypothetical protein